MITTTAYLIKCLNRVPCPVPLHFICLGDSVSRLRLDFVLQFKIFGKVFCAPVGMVPEKWLPNLNRIGDEYHNISPTKLFFLNEFLWLTTFNKEETTNGPFCSLLNKV